MIDTRLPILAAQGAQVNLADIYQQQHQMDMQRQQMERAQKLDARQDQQYQDQQVQQQQAQQREQAGMIAKLTQGVSDEATYQQRLAAARTYGLDVSSAPPAFDPQWVQTQNVIASMFLNEPEKLTKYGEAARDMGFEPGSPQFEKAVTDLVMADYTKLQAVEAGGMLGSVAPGQGFQPLVVPNQGGGQAGAPSEGATATNPQTGEKIIFQGGQWVPMGGGSGNAAGDFPGQ